jgi:hypothetical protein
MPIFVSWLGMAVTSSRLAGWRDGAKGALQMEFATARIASAAAGR